MRTTTAPTIRLQDYAPAPFSVSTVDLDVQLAPEETIVTASLEVKREKSADPDSPLILDGDELELLSVEIDGEILSDKQYTLDEQRLTIPNPPSSATFTSKIVTRLNPAGNTKLMGLYQSNGVYCTQCEAEGFRRITFFPDRPDILSVYTVRIEGSKEEAEHLLSNGNPVEHGELENGRHYAVWHDPHPKPCYLFALVAGNLDCLSDTFTTASGKAVDLNIFVETGKQELATYAMDALKRSMVWDEETYGCEYDLDVFNIVAVSDFNMGAMENKGLNVFNDKYVLASPEIATDSDYANIESIIAHEYFHNWTGNRITCRDWFQLCLKEGLTVYRDQEFSADQRSRPVQRIQQVRVLKAGQFKEDAGPLAHPVRPAEYKEINNFYTATVYQKGAELVRMLATICGPDLYRKATDLYFERHDGEAAIMEDFIRCFEDVSGRDLSQFLWWYAQAGTPEISVSTTWDQASGTYSLSLSQHTDPTPGQNEIRALPIPIRFQLIDGSGKTVLAETSSPLVNDDVILLTTDEAVVTFEGLKNEPVPSLLQGFSAPVILRHDETEQSRLFRAKHDPDPFNRWSAVNQFIVDGLIASSKEYSAHEWSSELLYIISLTLADADQDAEFRAQFLSIPGEAEIARGVGENVDTAYVHKAKTAFLAALGDRLGPSGIELIHEQDRQIPAADELDAAGMRALKNALFAPLLAAKIEGAVDLISNQYRSADTMTDRLAAFSSLRVWSDNAALADDVTDDFYGRYKDIPLVINTWFQVQAQVPGEAGLELFTRLLKHPDFTLNNPNRARSLLGPFVANNLSALHHPSGKGVESFADQIIAFDDINPQVAARLLTMIGDWKILERNAQDNCKAALSRIAAKENISRDLEEIVSRTLA